MNELAKMGFIYDVEQIDPNGQIVGKQKVKNIITNEGINTFLKQYFSLKGTSYSGSNKPISKYALLFIESDQAPEKTDVFKTSWEKYKVDMQLWSDYIGNKNHPMLLTFNKVSGSDELITSNKITYTFTEYKVITGCCIIGGSMSYNSSIAAIKNCFGISAALFYTPVQIVPNGSISITPSFTVIGG